MPVCRPPPAGAPSKSAGARFGLGELPAQRVHLRIAADEGPFGERPKGSGRLPPGIGGRRPDDTALARRVHAFRGTPPCAFRGPFEPDVRGWKKAYDHLPWKFRRDAARAPVTSRLTGTRVRGVKGLVLIVDDCDDERVSLAGVLREDGYEVHEARDGVEAMEQLHAGLRPNVILLDLFMPLKDGWEFRVDQTSDPDLAAIPVIAMSGRMANRPIDADRFLRKPFPFLSLLRTLQEVQERPRSAC